MATLKKPTPKMTPVGMRPQARWYNFYAMFSEAFTRVTLEREAVGKAALVLDPWLGSGTTTATAAELGIRSVGFDINPTMVQISNGRLASVECAAEAVRQLDCIRTRTVAAIEDADPLLGWFAPITARAFRFWQREIERRYASDDERWTEGFLNTAMFDCAKSLAGPYRSRNPTWLKKPAPEDRVAISSADVKKAFLNCAQSRISLCRGKRPCFAPRIEIADARHLPLRENSADMVLTSPPYCTRIDYAVTTSLELAILGISDLDVRRLRDQTMGTSTICARNNVPSDSFGTVCDEFLQQVLEHESKASKSYYFKNFLQYFADLHMSLREIDRCVRPGGIVVIVVQDSVYKGIHINLARIIEEMSSELGWHLATRHDFCSLSNMSPQTRASVNTWMTAKQLSLHCTFAQNEATK